MYSNHFCYSLKVWTSGGRLLDRYDFHGDAHLHKMYNYYPNQTAPARRA